jgi:hypothetical protein
MPSDRPPAADGLPESVTPVGWSSVRGYRKAERVSSLTGPLVDRTVGTGVVGLDDAARAAAAPPPANTAAVRAATPMRVVLDVFMTVLS